MTCQGHAEAGYKSKRLVPESMLLMASGVSTTFQLFPCMSLPHISTEQLYMGHLPSACLSTGTRIRREGGARLPAAADLGGGCGEDLPQPTTHRPAHGLLWPKAVTQLIGQLMNMPENLQLLRFHVVHLGCPCSHRSQPYLSIISTCQSYLHNIPGYDLPSVSLTTDQQSQPIYIQCPPWTDSFNLLMPQFPHIPTELSQSCCEEKEVNTCKAHITCRVRRKGLATSFFPATLEWVEGLGCGA